MANTTDNRIPFGLRAGELVEVSQVPRGRACGCVCASCGRPLQARKGSIRAHYFAHDPVDGPVVCVSPLETSIHLMAKEILKEDGSLLFPELTLKREGEDLLGRPHSKELQLEEAKKRFFEGVELEKRLHGIRPDIIAYIEEEPFIIEVAVTHFADREKKKKIRRLGLPAIEIDLSSIRYDTTKDDLRNRIQDESTKKTWLSNPKAIKAKEKLEAELNSEIDNVNAELARNAQLQKEARERSAQLRKEALESRASSVQGSLSLGERHIHRSDSKEETRWFICEACRDIFETPVSVANESGRNIGCPSCGHEVSKQSGRHKK